MILLDTNIFIYLAQGKLSPKHIKDTDIAYASITKIEALGYPTLPANELILLTELFQEAYNLELSDAIVEQAIALKQTRSTSLGDAIIAATALEHQLELWTANEADFKSIEGLTLVNPLSPE